MAKRRMTAEERRLSDAFSALIPISAEDGGKPHEFVGQYHNDSGHGSLYILVVTDPKETTIIREYLSAIQKNLEEVSTYRAEDVTDEERT